MPDESVTNEPMYGTLKALSADVAGVRDAVRSLANETRALKGHVAALVQADVGRDERIANLELRVERIETRLELNEGKDPRRELQKLRT